MDLERNGNFFEAGLWFVLAFALFIYAFRREKQIRPTLLGLAVTLAIFGASDLVEAQTGAWWTPWWLFVWKSVCVAGLLVGFVRYYRLEKFRRAAPAQSDGDTARSGTGG